MSFVPSIFFLGVTLGAETFTHLDYADDVALLAEMLEVLSAGSGSSSFGP